jgi:cobaltochelatase CobS
MTANDLNQKTVGELRKMYREVTGRKGAAVLSLSKPQLIEGILRPAQPQPAPQETPPTKPEASELADVLTRLLANPAIDENQVTEIAKKVAIETIAPMLDKIKPVVYKVPGRPEPIKVGRQHKVFKDLMILAGMRQNVMLVGPAGSGKTTVAESVAKALELPFYAISVGQQTSKSDLLGYMSASGEYVPTNLRRAFEHGGIFLFDEIDAGNASTMTVINAMTANSVGAFPDGMIKRHKDFICIAAGNTYGRGADMQYVGRQRLDAATLDRFAVLEMGYDLELEMSISCNEEWTGYVQKLRSAAEAIKAKVIISPRASIKGGQMLEAGLSKKKVADILIWKGVSEDVRKKIEAQAK